MTVIPFPAKTLSEHGPLLLSIDIYDTPGFSDYVVKRHDGQEVDLGATIEKVSNVLRFLHYDRFLETGDDEHHLMLTLQVFASSAIWLRWLDEDDDITTPDGLRWFRRRLGDAYWSLDQRRGPAYYWHILCGKIRNLLHRRPKDVFDEPAPGNP